MELLCPGLLVELTRTGGRETFGNPNELDWE